MPLLKWVKSELVNLRSSNPMMIKHWYEIVGLSEAAKELDRKK
jgi:hypothetical protein